MRIWINDKRYAYFGQSGATGAPGAACRSLSAWGFHGMLYLHSDGARQIDFLSLARFPIFVTKHEWNDNVLPASRRKWALQVQLRHIYDLRDSSVASLRSIPPCRRSFCIQRALISNTKCRRCSPRQSDVGEEKRAQPNRACIHVQM